MCSDEGVALRSCGKVVVARNDTELERLRELHRRAIANGVEVKLVDPDELRLLEPLARTHCAALWSPNTAVADASEVTEMLARVFVRLGGKINLNSRASVLAGTTVVLESGHQIEAKHIVNAAGLYADKLAHSAGVGLDYVVLPFKGLYVYGDETAPQLTRHVYPVPDPRNPFLGVHLTVTVGGGCKIGPTAIPALSRLNYTKLGGIKRDELWSIVTTLPRFLLSEHHDGPALVRSEFPKYLRRVLVKQAAALVPEVRQNQFTKWGKSGIRAQLFNVKERQLEMDFVVADADNQTHVLNAVSPAWTGSLSFGEYVAKAVLDRM
jgi:L-2-hydroxyglutarate oxidase LhgO